MLQPASHPKHVKPFKFTIIYIVYALSIFPLHPSPIHSFLTISFPLLCSPLLFQELNSILAEGQCLNPDQGNFEK